MAFACRATVRQVEAHLFSFDAPAQQGSSLRWVWKRGIALEIFLLGGVGISWDNRRAEPSLKQLLHRTFASGLTPNQLPQRESWGYFVYEGNS